MAGSPEQVPELPILPAGHWRSRGRVLDYARWRDRVRFRELDGLIDAAAARERALWAARQRRWRAAQKPA